MATSDSGLLDSALFEPLRGDSVVVADHADRYLTTADAINAAALSLIRISGQQDAVGHAFDSVRELTDEVAGDIGQAEERYRATAQALAEYAVDLSAAQDRANRAITAAGSAQGEAGTWAGQVEALRDAALIPGPEQLASQQRLARAESRLDTAEGAQAGAAAEYNAAVADKNDAAERASARIEAVVKGSPLNDSMWSNIGGFLAGVGGWIADVLGAVIDFVAAAVDVIARLLVAVLIVVALAALLILVLATLGVALGVLVAVLALAIIASVALVALALRAMLKERGTPTVTALGSRSTVSNPSDPYAAVFLEQRRVDGLGTDIDHDGEPDNAVIRVTQVVGADGVSRWRVLIPSTQVWSPFSDDAPNDLNSDLVAKLNPAQRTQLEKAVQTALEQTEGYTAGDPVMLTGFSLGGITAGNLAADADFVAEFNVQAVLTAGSPLDDIAIESSVSVLSLEHDSDPVANGGDLLAGHRHDANRYVVDVPAPAAVPDDWGTGSSTPAPFGHGAVDYAVTAQNEITRSDHPRAVAFRERTAEFFGGTQRYFDYQVVRG
ncbi:hypothetical protein E3T55_00100 [Cryobacterium frigoriphilum]|uniref:Uncharacterized protein n=1 Tax=Cryobacterium frigoriphilum TaxID=1259150 RepID=A0A4R9ABD1_9MICO|nr:hypothetical protein [Cryobacterium frigoriphilum]TFD56085.1 hypothetical protein E3T55_00100 [Cryobacterium frigoriphilum]